MNLAIVAQLVQILKEAPELGAIEVRRGLFGRWSSIRVTKVGHGANAGGGGGGGAPHLVVAQASGGGLVPGTAAAAPAAAPKAQLVDIKSPMVGTFYSAPEPGAEPYVKAGSRVAAGQVVCIIEAMKIMNEIEAEVAGLVREVCVENAQPVEFGQPLFRVDPHG
ncbi:MAG: acetyl-CoA carboxylase, biotin carboxyl carrier protein [Gemmatimonadetes bacterium 13_1_40CM_3_70_8]|nr:MAG: acetyl-CoA carboxylase, biotin carboxyl carrier protein [Gemmatimonadetes bacterium 13_1_40CM_3_70_8]